MCGEIDEEITIPELVKEGSLCPHQDYVYFNYPTKEEEKEVRRFEERSKAMTEKIMRDTQFLTYVRSHKGFSGQLSDDLLLDNPAYLASLLIYLQSNIWHLVCLRPWNEVLKADDNQISEDYSMLERRMEHFLGLHYTENTIENGMKRLSVIKTPFNKTNIDRINRQMLKMSGQRDTLKERWNSALAVYDKMDIVDETEVKDKFVTSVVFWDAILTMILSGILCLIGAIGAGIVAAASQNGILAGTCYFFIAAGLAGIMIRFPKIFMLGSPLKRLKAFGNGIRKALEEQQLLEETHCKVETESNGPDNHIIYLSGGSGRDKALFAQCVNEFFDVIDNQRYILVKKKGHKGLNGFYAIPNCFSKKKEDAERFAKCMHPYIGNYDCVYTRNEKGRELLLEGRVKALANREERCISHKKVKGALE